MVATKVYEYDKVTIPMVPYLGEPPEDKVLNILNNLSGHRIWRGVLITPELVSDPGYYRRETDYNTYHEHILLPGSSNIDNVVLEEDLPILQGPKEDLSKRYWFHSSELSTLDIGHYDFHVGTIRAALYRRTSIEGCKYLTRFRGYVHVLQLNPEAQVHDAILKDDGMPESGGKGVVRYINTYEAPGSVSLVTSGGPDDFKVVDTIKISETNPATRLWEVPRGAQRKLREYAEATVSSPW